VRRSESFWLSPPAQALLWAGLSAQAAASTVTATAGDPLLALLAHGGLLVGTVVSLLNLRWRKPLDALGYALIAGALALFVGRPSGAAPSLLFFPSGAVDDTNLAAGTLVLWVLVGFSFLQYRRHQLIFVSACGLAIFGTVGLINLEPGFLVAFAVYIFATLLAWAYEGLGDLAGAWLTWPRRLLRDRAVTAASVLAFVSAGALVTGNLLYWLLPNPFGTATRLRPVWSFAGTLFAGGLLSREELAVGAGPVELSDEVLFWISSGRNDLWRVAAYDHYDGHAWRMSAPRTYLLPRYDRDANLIPQVVPASARLSRQRVWVARFATSRLPAAAEPIRLRFLAGPLPGLRYAVSVDAYGCLNAGPPAMPGAAYEVVSALPESDPVRLRAAGTNYPAEITSLYLAPLPLGTREALSPLVASITAGAATPYDQALALMAFLERECFYSTREPATPLGEDVAVHFLLQSRRGACDQFATAMAVMLRLAGVPARIATGYLTEERDPDNGLLVLRASGAHAWVEAYFPGYGWVPFNPSPQRSVEEESWWSLLRRGQAGYVAGQAAKGIGLSLAGLAVLLLLLMAVIDPRVAQARWLDAWAGRDPWERAFRECRRAALAASRTALRQPTAGLTPLEALEVAGQSRATAAVLPRLRQLTGELYEARYSPRSGTPQQARRLAHEFRALRRRLPRPRRGKP